MKIKEELDKIYNDILSLKKIPLKQISYLVEGNEL
jgi:hypothetical protein